ncbi:MAG: tRNA uridine-5-carboxymethylaminomethyl(34) synthesis enzyme MnmG, partial [Desulfobacterales bacterium]|nr:tRNA uridine-5-carboxymethylaminomethyl(34) synthesis enzyme MnmG [Desulfobacterales bacterium]
DQILKRPELSYQDISTLDAHDKKIDERIARHVEIEIKYEGYIQRQLREVEKFKSLEKIKIPQGFDYTRVHGLSNELREKLSTIKPISLGQASRIPGITPAAISILMIYLKKSGSLP